MFIEKMWKKKMKKSLKLATKLSDSEIDNILDKEFKKNFKDHPAIVYNSYERESFDTTIAECLDWIRDTRPIVCESGGFFKRADQGRAKHAMIVEGNLDNRVQMKKTMFDYMVAGDRVNEIYYDNLQKLEKLSANAPYGVDSNKYSFSYSYIIASTTTFVGRGQTSIGILCFEELLYGSIKFWNMEEMMTYILNIIEEKDSWRFDTLDIIDHIPKRKELVAKLVNKFESNNYDEEIIVNIVNSLSEEDFLRVFYKGNFREFMKNSKIKKYINFIANSDAKLYNPYDSEKEIKAELDLLCELFDEFVNYKDRWFRYEDKARRLQRDAVVVSDTDSAIIQLGDTLNYTVDKYNLQKRVEEDSDTNMKIVNIFIAIMTLAIKNTLAVYLDWVNVDNSKGRVKMKNEFLMEIIFVTLNKKAYISTISIKEGRKMAKPKLDLKGVTFGKSSATKNTSEFITNEIIMKEIMQTGGKINLPRISRKINGYMENMKSEILQGGLDYYNTNTAVKDIGAYASPSSIPGIVGTHLWNLIYPDKEILLPSTVCLVKLRGFNEHMLEPVRKKSPEIYEKLCYFLKNDDMFKRGIRYLCLPDTEDKVPDWALSILDIGAIISTNMGLFAQITKPLNIPQITVKDNSRDLKFYSGVIKL